MPQNDDMRGSVSLELLGNLKSKVKSISVLDFVISDSELLSLDCTISSPTTVITLPFF